MSRIAVRATPAGVRHVRSGHPWLFDGSIASVSRDGEPGELAVVFDKERRFAGIGLYDPDSPIRVKLLHHGDPVTVDETFWRAKVAAAFARRAGLLADPETTGYRLIHGENDGLPGLVLDRYVDVSVLKLYSRAWLPHLETLVPIIDAALPSRSLIVRYSRAAAPRGSAGPADASALIGAVPDAPVLFSEHGLLMEADVVRGQKTGYFLDQRDNRARVRDLARGARVLDMFACSGGFSLAAAAGGAISVHSVDLAADALTTARRNMEHNRGIAAVAACSHRTTTGDAFEVMERLVAAGETYDLVIVDPPSFAQRQSSVAGALRAYGRLTRLGVALTERGGVYVQSSCSSRVTAEEFFPGIIEHANVAGVRLQELERTGHAVDHPIGFPEGAYLKTLFARRR
jgi:23S rRNA (cytosine1962-C5)-methyltransferase